MTKHRENGQRRWLREGRSRRPVAAAVALACEHGLLAGEPCVLNDLFSLMVHLRRTPVVARVATCMPGLRSPVAQWLEREIAVTEFHSEQGAPVAGPSREMLPGPHEHDGFWVSFWTYVEPDQARILTTSDCSAMLLVLHDVPAVHDGSRGAALGGCVSQRRP